MGCRSNGRHGQSLTIHGKESQALTLDEGAGPSASRRKTLEAAEGELRRLFGKQKA